jgi:hypothetical protein
LIINYSNKFNEYLNYIDENSLQQSSNMNIKMEQKYKRSKNISNCIGLMICYEFIFVDISLILFRLVNIELEIQLMML